MRGYLSMKRLRIPLLCALVLPASPLFAEDAAVFKADVELNANRGAFEFDGLGPGIDLGRSNILNLSGGDFTIHAWVKLATDCNDSGAGSGPPCDMSIVDKMASADSVNNYGWRLLKQSDGHFWFCLGGGPGNGCDGSTNTTVIGRTVAVTGVWYSVVAVKTSRRISIYVNGVLEATTLLGAYYDSSDVPVLVGANTPEGAYLIGQVGQVQLFKSALSGQLVRAAFELSKERYGY
jgi:hypothetical protein